MANSGESAFASRKGSSGSPQSRAKRLTDKSNSSPARADAPVNSNPCRSRTVIAWLPPRVALAHSVVYAPESQAEPGLGAKEKGPAHGRSGPELYIRTLLPEEPSGPSNLKLTLRRKPYTVLQHCAMQRRK